MFYVNPNSEAIHSDGGDGFVKPRTDSTVLCGQKKVNLIPYAGNIRREPHYRLCLKCESLDGFSPVR